MPITRTEYICTDCHAKYLSREAAEECEAGHLHAHDLRVITTHHFGRLSLFPNYIEVQAEEGYGGIRRYKYDGLGDGDLCPKEHS